MIGVAAMLLERPIKERTSALCCVAITAGIIDSAYPLEETP